MDKGTEKNQDPALWNHPDFRYMAKYGMHSLFVFSGLLLILSFIKGFDFSPVIIVLVSFSFGCYLAQFMKTKEKKYLMWLSLPAMLIATSLIDILFDF